MNSGALINRLKIAIYSTMTSAMSGFNHLKTKVNRSPDSLDWLPVEGEALTSEMDYPATQKKHWLSWETLKTSVLVLVLWLVLGFAAGFLIGMIKPW